MTQAAISNSFSIATIDDGKDGAFVQLSRSTILYNANSTGSSTSSQAFAITYSLIVGNVTISASNVTATVSTPTNTTATNVSSSGCTINVANGKSPNGVITITLTGTYNNNSYTAKGTITIAPNKAGENGVRGKVGRFYYYGGVFVANDTSNLFPVNNAQAPFFSHSSNGQTQYHVFNPDEDVDDEFTMKEMWDESSQSWNNSPWVAMTNDFKYLITEAIFSNFAQFGSAIISGDWMMSTNGTIGSSASDDYTKFDPAYPYQSVDTTHNVNGTTWTGYNFVPNYCVDLLTGATFQQNAYIIGKIYSTIGEIGGFVLGQNYIGDIQNTDDIFIGSRIYSGGGAMFGNNQTNGYALRTTGTVEMVGNGKNIIINTITGNPSQHGDFVINGWIKMINLPTSSSGLSSGEVYVDNGVLKIKT